MAASENLPARAARLWAAAESLREAAGLGHPPSTRVTTGYEGRLAAARAELGEEAFERVWSEGGTMTTQEAVRYALSKEESAPPSRSGGPLGDTGAGRLTRREQEIAKLVAQGLTNHRIASELVISERTVTTHIGRIFKKLEIYSRDRVKDLLSDRE